MAGSISEAPLTSSLLRFSGLLGTLGLGAALALSLSINAAFVGSFSSARLAPVLCLLLLLHIARFPAVLFCRETKLYLAFFCYLLLQTLWSPDPRLALNTLIPAGNFVLILLLSGSLVAYHNPRAVFFGLLLGSLAGAAAYSLSTGFPLTRPTDFSYNAIATMYLSGLFTTLAVGVLDRRRLAILPLAILFLLLTLATTSIKTNLGILLGAAVAGLFYAGRLARALGRNLLLLGVVVIVLAYLLASSESVQERLAGGFDRIRLGIELILVRQDLPGYSAMGDRLGWIQDGLAGWVENPVFGHGVEAFRSAYGITSHSTPIDLLYNSGLIGTVLFYSVLISLLLRVRRLGTHGSDALPMVILGTVICYLFISISGTMHYSSFLALFIGSAHSLILRISNSGDAARFRTGHSR